MKNYFILVEDKKMFKKTAYIVNSNYELQTTIIPVFDDDGEFTSSITKALKKYRINNMASVQRKTIFFGDTYEEGLENLRFELEEVPKIEKFLTPEKQKELMNIFKM